MNHQIVFDTRDNNRGMLSILQRFVMSALRVHATELHVATLTAPTYCAQQDMSLGSIAPHGCSAGYSCN